MAGDYSTTPLWKKLGLKPGLRLFVASAPYTLRRAALRDLLREFPPARHPSEADVVDNKSASIDADWQAVRFVVRREDRASWPAALDAPR